MSKANNSHQRGYSNHSNPIYSLENGTVSLKSSGVTVGYCGAKVTVEILDRARAYAAAVPGAISGSRGHDHTFALANALTWGFALDEQTALSLMLEWNAGCQPPWKERELRHKIQQSQKASHQKPFGYLLTADERPQSFRAPSVAPPAETAVWKIKRHPAAAEGKLTTAHSPEASESPMPLVQTNPTDGGLAAIPGCRVKRPEEIEMADTDWQQLDASGFADEPMVQLAASMFGPGCTMVESGRARPRGSSWTAEKAPIRIRGLSTFQRTC